MRARRKNGIEDASSSVYEPAASVSAVWPASAKARDASNAVHRMQDRLADHFGTSPRRVTGYAGPLIVAPALLLGLAMLLPVAIVMTGAARGAAMLSSRGAVVSIGDVLAALLAAAGHASRAAAGTTR